MTTGQRIGELAKTKGINLHKLADDAEISYNTLYSIVRRKSDKVDLDTVRKIALALDVHPIEILGDSAIDLIDYGMDLTARGLKAIDKALETDGKFDDFGLRAILSIADEDQETFVRKKQLDKAFKRLNEKGQAKAVEFVEVLASHADYQSTTPVEPSKDSNFNTDTTE